SCQICPGETSKWKKVNEYDIYRCKTCGFGFVHPQLTQAQIKEIYTTSGHGAKYQETSLEQVEAAERTYPNSLIDCVRLVRKIQKHRTEENGLALDVGAGYGFYTRELQQAGYEVTPLELAANEKKILYEMTGNHPVSTTYEDFETDQQYGVILMSQILEHAADPILWAQKTHDLLDKDGLWIIAVPHFNSWSRYLMQEKEFYIIPPEHLNYFTNKSLRKLVEDNGFEVLESQTISRLPWHKLKVPGIKYLGNPFLKLMDNMGLGMMLNIVARKR
ncbi:MAG: class I SAM-dependent methyltransferase, partial [Cyclobacteriaceae bacterium]